VNYPFKDHFLASDLEKRWLYS